MRKAEMVFSIVIDAFHTFANNSENTNHVTTFPGFLSESHGRNGSDRLLVGQTTLV